MYVITILCEGHEPFEAKLIPGAYRVGASPACHLQMSGDGVAPRHCQLIVGENSLRVQAFDQRHPVYLDGRELGSDPADADPGSEIRLGNVVIQLNGPEGMSMKDELETLADLPPEPAPAAPQTENRMEGLLRSEHAEDGTAVLGSQVSRSKNACCCRRSRNGRMWN